MLEEKITTAGIIRGWKLAQLNGPEALRAILSIDPKELDCQSPDQQPYGLMNRLIHGWYNNQGDIATMINSLMTILQNTTTHCDFNGYYHSELLRCIIEKFRRSIPFPSSWETLMPQITFLYSLAAEAKGENYETIRLLVMNCARDLPLLTADEELKLLPESSDFREWYALGVLLQKGNALASLRGIRYTESIGTGKAGKECSHSAEDIADVVLSLMQSPNSNGCANDQIHILMSRLSGMTGGEEARKRIKSEAPNHRRGQFVE